MDTIERVARKIAFEHGGTVLRHVGSLTATVAVQAGFGADYRGHCQYAHEKWPDYESAARAALSTATVEG